jgi:hypothetical protein
MTFLEPIAAAVVAALVTAGANKVSTLKSLGAAIKYGPLLKKAFDIVDPVLIQFMRGWNGSQTEKAIELSVEVVGDGKLTGEEIKTIAAKVAELWIPSTAVAKVAKFNAAANTPVGLAASRFIADHINGIKTKEEAISSIKKLITGK